MLYFHVDITVVSIAFVSKTLVTYSVSSFICILFFVWFENYRPQETLTIILNYPAEQKIWGNV